MITDKLRKRARDLAQHAAGDGVESELAKARLATLVEQHPGLTYLMGEDALWQDTVHVTVTTPVHGELLTSLGTARDCDVNITPAFAPPEPHQVSLVHWTLSGTRGNIRRTLDAYAEHGDALTALFDQLGQAYLHTALTDEPEPFIDVMPDNDNAVAEFISSLLSAPHTPTPWEVHADAQRSHTDTIVAKLPRLAMNTLCVKLVHLASVLHGPPAMLLGQRTVVWDDPTLSWEDFLMSYRTLVPNGTLDETDLCFMYRDGYRLYPLTRRLRMCSALAKPSDWVPDSWK